jgi:hypothetical protein
LVPTALSQIAAASS